jgi:hypothetical protein
MNDQKAGKTISGTKLQQVDEEISFPAIFSYEPWGHHAPVSIFAAGVVFMYLATCGYRAKLAMMV